MAEGKAPPMHLSDAGKKLWAEVVDQLPEELKENRGLVGVLVGAIAGAEAKGLSPAERAKMLAHIVNVDIPALIDADDAEIKSN